jgi:23S rRNA (uridine2552-2'-O)-methyltransferase
MRLKSTKVKTAKNRSLSSSEWLRRQLNDEYVILSKKEGYRSRAAYKLIEINNKFSFLKLGQKIVDLGAAPGGWSQVASNIIGKNGKVIAIDLLDIPSIDNVDFIQGDFCSSDSVEKLLSMLNGKANIILSDMAPNTTGHKTTDHLRIMDLCERVFEFAKTCLEIDGTLVIKIFQGGATSSVLSEIKKSFKDVKHFKPEASRKESSEVYLVARGYRGEEI